MEHMLHLIDESDVDWHEFKNVMYSSEIPNKRSVDITLGYLQGRQIFLKNNMELQPYHIKEFLFSGECKDNLLKYIFPMFNVYELAKTDISLDECAYYCQFDNTYKLPEKIFRMVNVKKIKVEREKELEIKRQHKEENARIKSEIQEEKLREEVINRLSLIENNCEVDFYGWYQRYVRDGKLPLIKDAIGLGTSLCYLQVHEDKSSTLYIDNSWKITLSDEEYKSKYKQLSWALFGKVEGIRDTRFDKTIIPISLFSGIKNVLLLVFYGFIAWLLLQVFGDFGSTVLRP
jgi:hypothetical protein